MRISHLNSAGRATAFLARRVGASLAPELLLRSSLGLVYFWFGTLKLVGLSPALELIRNAYPPMATMPLYFGLALFEVTLGLRCSRASGCAQWRQLSSFIS
jgi:hypothetical protein